MRPGKDFAFTPVQAEKLLWKIRGTWEEPRRGCNANRITRNRNLGAHYTGVWGAVLGFRETGQAAPRLLQPQRAAFTRSRRIALPVAVSPEKYALSASLKRNPR